LEEDHEAVIKLVEDFAFLELLDLQLLKQDLLVLKSLCLRVVLASLVLDIG